MEPGIPSGGARLGAGAAAPLRLNPELRTGRWSARWITAAGAGPFEFGVYYFRRVIDLPSPPASFVVHVSGDNRYQFFVNGARVVWGPARGDLFHWRFETVDLAPYLRAGRNVLAAVVWNFAELAPQAQVTSETGFLLQGDTEAERVADTDSSWKGIRSEAYEPLAYNHHEMRGYFVVGPGERVTGERVPWGWETLEFDDSAWPAARAITPAAARDARDSPNRWMLVARTIPLMEETPERLLRLREAEGVEVPEGFPAQPAPLRVPPRTRARLLLDRTVLTTAYPELVVSGGRGARVSLGYAEALFLPGGRHSGKGHRDEVAGKEFVGYRDVFLPDGGAGRLFRPLWWRTYRYLECVIETADDPLTVEDLRGVFTAYPFERRARFEADLPRLAQFLEVGWRTARLCAHETYMDCPYYEQLQYAGDTRIQALISLSMTGDGRLMRNAIAQLDDSRTPEGATFSRAPTRLQQYIPSFCLWWIGMLHDYWRYQDEPEFVRAMLPGVRAVLGFFAGHQKADGSLGPLPWWRNLDWVKEWPHGEPPQEADGSSAPFDLQLLLALGWAAELEAALGSQALAGEYRQSEERLRATIPALYWDAGRGLFADTPRKAAFSQHANALAVLAGLVTGEAARALIERTLADRSLAQCSLYFRHYLHSAVLEAGEGDRYLDLLGDWHAMLDRGLTTWPEVPEVGERVARSDCHAWSASPNFELFRTVLGIDSAAPGFRRVRIRPHLGRLTHASGAIPHPRGEVAVDLALAGETLKAAISLPEGVEGEFIWRGKRLPLAPGVTRLSL